MQNLVTDDFRDEHAHGEALARNIRHELCESRKEMQFHE